MTINQIIDRVKKDERYLLILGFLIITAVFSPYVYFGEDIHTPIFDNLDSNIVWAKMVLDQGGPFLSPAATINQMMDGVPLSSICPSYDISFLWFKLFGMFWGYVFSKYLVALIGFFGMYFLLRKHILPADSPLYIPTIVAVLFALLPFWSFTATISGLPLAVLALLNFRKGDLHIRNWIFLFIYAFYSSLVLTGFFLLVCVSFLWLWDCIRSKSFNRNLFIGIVFLSLMYIISHLPLFYSFVGDSAFVSHRFEFNVEIPALVSIIKIMIKTLIYGEMDTGHALSLQKYILISVLSVGFLMIRNRKINKLFVFIITWIFASVVFLCIYSILFRNINKLFPIDMGRILWLHPLCWYLLFAMVLYFLYKEFEIGKYLCLIIVLIQFIYILSYQPYYRNKNLPSYKEFYAELQLHDIKEYINKNQSSYKVISIWLHPAISQYNGFYTVDGFSANYPLMYKHRFRKVIEKELDKRESIKNNFELWGSRCYAYSAELGLNSVSYDNNLPEIQHLDYNYDLLEEMGGQYIISSTKINTINNPRLRLMKVFDNYKSSHWTIYLYEIC